MANFVTLEEQLCFPIYVLAREITKAYRPMLDELDLTYPQYLVLLVLWEQKEQTVNQLGEKLHLDSGTLTPLLKRLEAKTLITRTRKKTDERSVEIQLTQTGDDLKSKVCLIQNALFEKINLTKDDFIALKGIISKIQL